MYHNWLDGYCICFFPKIHIIKNEFNVDYRRSCLSMHQLWAPFKGNNRLRENLSTIIEAQKKKYYCSQIFQIENFLSTNDSYKFSEGITVW